MRQTMNTIITWMHWKIAPDSPTIWCTEFDGDTEYELEYIEGTTLAYCWGVGEEQRIAANWQPA